jgi:SAM-dependent methyltransferase
MSGPPKLIDRPAHLAHRRRAFAARVERADFLYRIAADDLVDRLGAIERQFPVAVEIGSPSSYLADALDASGKVGTVVSLDPVVPTAGASRRFVAGDADAFPFADRSLDLVVSALHLHWLDDLPGALAQIRRALRPDGLFLASLLGGDTLAELRDCLALAEAEVTGGAAPRVLPFADVRSLGALLQRAGLALPVTDRDRRTVRYASALDLMRDLRAMGAANPLLQRSRKPLRRAVLLRAAALYGERFADPDGRIRATFEFVSLSGWAPHESQQKALKPGSAKMRLADALKAIEPAGRKP